MAIVINGSGTIAGITAGGLEEYVVNATVDTMTGDNSDVTLALSVAPGSENNVQITFDGVTQHHSTFSLSGSTITFSTAPATGVAVEAITGGSSTTGTPDNDTVDGTKIADNACNSEHYTDGSIDLVHLQTGTDGQIISWDASGDPVAVGPGTDGQVLTSTGAGSPPAFEAVPASTTIKIGGFSKDIADASGTLAITGVGFQPTVVMFFATVSGGSGFSVGSNDLTTRSAFYDNQASSDNTWGNLGAGTIMMERGSGNQYKGVVNSMDVDVFTIGWTKVSSISGTMQVTWHAMR